MHEGAWEIMLSTHRHLLGGELPGTSVQAVPEVDQKACDTQDPLSLLLPNLQPSHRQMLRIATLT